MAIQRYMVWHGALHGKPNSIADNTEVVEYTDHIAECRERERAAFYEGAKWAEDDIGDGINGDLKAEVRRRYGEGRGT